jgi:hypothetical protein
LLGGFFALVRPHTRGDDRSARAIQLILPGTAVIEIMCKLNLHSHIRGRDNSGGTAIGSRSVDQNDLAGRQPDLEPHDPRVIASVQTGSDAITVPEIRDDSQLPLLTAISGDSIPQERYIQTKSLGTISAM